MHLYEPNPAVFFVHHISYFVFSTSLDNTFTEFRAPVIFFNKTPQLDLVSLVELVSEGMYIKKS